MQLFIAPTGSLRFEQRPIRRRERRSAAEALGRRRACSGRSHCSRGAAHRFAFQKSKLVNERFHKPLLSHSQSVSQFRRSFRAHHTASTNSLERGGCKCTRSRVRCTVSKEYREGRLRMGMLRSPRSTQVPVLALRMEAPRDPPVSYLFRFGFRWAFDRKNGQQLSAERDIIESEVGKLPLSLYRVWITETPRRGTTTSQAARNPEKPQGVVRLYSSLARLPL